MERSANNDGYNTERIRNRSKPASIRLDEKILYKQDDLSICPDKDENSYGITKNQSIQRLGTF